MSAGWITATLECPEHTDTQDRLVVINEADRVVIALADGAGGMSGGARAAELAVKTATEFIRASRHRLEGRDCKALLERVDLAVEADRDAGETTLVLVVVTEEGLCGASVGDSDAWVVGGTGVVRLTSEQARKPLLGSGVAIPVGFAAPALAGGTLVVGSDGLFRYGNPETIRTLAQKSPLDVVATELLDSVRLQSGALQDDFSVVLCRSG